MTAILSLALGIGATVSVFSVIYGVLLHPFPYADVDRIGNLSIRDTKGILSDAYFTGPQLRELRKVHAFEGFATWRPDDLRVTGEEIPEAVTAFYGIGETFPTLGVPALLGRDLGPSDSPDGQEPQPVVMLHYRFWQRHFHGDPAVIGKTLDLNHKKYTIIGVSSAEFHLGLGRGCVSAAGDWRREGRRRGGEAASGHEPGSCGCRIATAAGTFCTRASGFLSQEVRGRHPLADV